MPELIGGLLDWVVVPLANIVGFAVASGTALLLYVVLWIGLCMELVRDEGRLQRDWEHVRALPIAIQGMVWLLFFPVVLALWVWRSGWPTGVRHLVVACLAGWSLLIFLPSDPMALTLSLVASAAAGADMLVLRPRLRRWGATEEEAHAQLPGDEVPATMGARRVSTRAITINARPEEVWPWLVQMGSGRAGFYTHEWVERLMAVSYADGHSANRIHPEFQDLHVGDRVAYSSLSTVPVELVDPPRCLMAGEWLVLLPLSGGVRTRLIARTRGGWLEPFTRRIPFVWPLLWPIAVFIDRGPGEVLHHYMEVGMLKGIKARAEAARAEAVRAAQRGVSPATS
jgi:hypothetical protein